MFFLFTYFLFILYILCGKLCFVGLHFYFLFCFLLFCVGIFVFMTLFLKFYLFFIKGYWFGLVFLFVWFYACDIGFSRKNRKIGRKNRFFEVRKI